MERVYQIKLKSGTTMFVKTETDIEEILEGSHDQDWWMAETALADSRLKGNKIALRIGEIYYIEDVTETEKKAQMQKERVND